MPTRLPWSDDPLFDRKAAQDKAIRAATAVPADLESPAVKAYARSALDREIRTLATTPSGGRNIQLFKSGANLYEIVAAGALDEATVFTALRDAMRDNGYERDKGPSAARAVERSIASARRHGFDNPRDLSHIGAHGRNGFVLDVPVRPTLASVYDMERGFWLERDSLQDVYLAALSRMCAPWAVLGFCAARALALVRPTTTLPPVIGGRGSLNWFCAVAAASGGGKGSANAVARELVPEPLVVRNLGSGEGLVDAYKTKESDEFPTGVRESVMFTADEIDSLGALAARSGSTLMGTLRSAFSGETLGFSYRSNSFHLEAHTYRMTLVASVQPGRAGTLLDDRHGGTLQRFMWFPGTDNRITDEPPLMPGALKLPEPGVWRYDRELKIPYAAQDLIRDSRVRINRGEGDSLDGHALFIREKFAYALAVLDGRDEMSTEDWRLAGIASRISDHTRLWVSSELERVQDEEEVKHGERQGIRSAAAREKESQISNAKMEDVYARVLGKIRDKGPVGVGEIQSFLGRQRHLASGALETLCERGYIVKDGKKWMANER